MNTQQQQNVGAPKVTPITTTKTSAETANNAVSTPQFSFTPGKAVMSEDLVKRTDELARQLRECLAYSIGWLIKSGDILNNHRSNIVHGDLTSMFNSGRLPFGQRYGQMLSAIARNRALMNPVLLQSLPNSIVALDVLASVNPELIEDGIKKGMLHQRLTRKSTLAALRILCAQAQIKNPPQIKS